MMKDQLENLVGRMVEDGILFPEAVNEFEKKFIKRMLDHTRGNQSRAARALGIHRNTLSRKIGLYKLDQRPRRRRGSLSHQFQNKSGSGVNQSRRSSVA